MPKGSEGSVRGAVGAAAIRAGRAVAWLEVLRQVCWCRGSFLLLTFIPPRQLRGLYKGMSSPMAGVAFVNAIVFGVHGNMVKHIQNPDSLRYTTAHAACEATCL